MKFKKKKSSIKNVSVGKNVTIVEPVNLYGCKIEDNCLIGMGSIIMDNAIIGEGSFIGAGAVIPPKMEIPSRSLVVGLPAKIIKYKDH